MTSILPRWSRFDASVRVMQIGSSCIVCRELINDQDGHAVNHVVCMYGHAKCHHQEHTLGLQHWLCRVCNAPIIALLPTREALPDTIEPFLKSPRYVEALLEASANGHDVCAELRSSWEEVFAHQMTKLVNQALLSPI
jgi:hypothetical protein